MFSPNPIDMTTDKVFILLLVILLPLTGCIDATDTVESQESVAEESNHPPVIYLQQARFWDYYDYSTSTSVEDVIVVTNGMAIDFDGNVTAFGIDTNQDGVIDYPLDNTGTIVSQAAYNPDNMTEWMNPMPYTSESCFQHLSIIAIDDDGAMTVEPFVAFFDWDDEADTCSLERN